MIQYFMLLLSNSVLRLTKASKMKFLLAVLLVLCICQTSFQDDLGQRCESKACATKRQKQVCRVIKNVKAVNASLKAYCLKCVPPGVDFYCHANNYTHAVLLGKPNKSSKLTAHYCHLSDEANNGGCPMGSKCLKHILGGNIGICCYDYPLTRTPQRHYCRELTFEDINSCPDQCSHPDCTGEVDEIGRLVKKCRN